jgi:hypothetical protein
MVVIMNSSDMSVNTDLARIQNLIKARSVLWSTFRYPQLKTCGLLHLQETSNKVHLSQILKFWKLFHNYIVQYEFWILLLDIPIDTVLVAEIFILHLLVLSYV